MTETDTRAEPTSTTEPPRPSPIVAWAPPATPSATPSGVRSARLRSRFAIGLLAVAAAVDVVAVLVDVIGLGVLEEALAGTLTEADAIAFDQSMATAGTTQTVVLVLTAIAFLAWLSRSVDNVAGLGGGTPVATPTMSIVWWFVPVANLVMPYRTVADLYRRMAPSERVGTGLVLAWWVVWILGNFVSQLAGLLWAGDTIEVLQSGLQLWVAADLLDVAAAVLAIVVIRRIQTWADVRHATPHVPAGEASAATAGAAPTLATGE